MGLDGEYPGSATRVLLMVCEEPALTYRLGVAGWSPSGWSLKIRLNANLDCDVRFDLHTRVNEARKCPWFMSVDVLSNPLYGLFWKRTDWERPMEQGVTQLRIRIRTHRPIDPSNQLLGVLRIAAAASTGSVRWT